MLPFIFQLSHQHKNMKKEFHDSRKTQIKSRKSGIYEKPWLIFFFAYGCPLFEFYTRTPTFIVVETLKDVSTYNYAMVNFGGMKQMRWK